MSSRVGELLQEGQHFLVHVFNTDQTINLKAVRKIKQRDVDELKDASRRVERYFWSQNVVQCVFANRNDVLSSMVEMAKDYFDRESHPESLMQYAILEISRKFANTCSLFRSLLDHFDRYFKHSHGKDSQAYAEWKGLLSEEYDKWLSYRVVYMMRNYIQHYDMPPLHVSIHEVAIKEGIETRFDIDMAALRKDNEIRKKLEKTGDDKIDHIPLFRVLDEWSECVNRITNMAVKYRLEDALPYAHVILGVRRELKVGDEGGLAPIWLPKVDRKPDKLSLSVGLLPEIKALHIVEEADRRAT